MSVTRMRIQRPRPLRQLDNLRPLAYNALSGLKPGNDFGADAIGGTDQDRPFVKEFRGKLNEDETVAHFLHDSGIGNTETRSIAGSLDVEVDKSAGDGIQHIVYLKDYRNQRVVG